MIERDYIMRMIQMLVQALIKIFSFKEKKDYPQALNEIQNASKSLIGVELDVIRRLSDVQIIDLLTLVKDFDGLKCYLAGVLLKEEADILELQGKEVDSVDTRMKSLSLLTEAVIEKGALLDSDHASAIDSVAAKLNHASLPVHIHKKVFHYYELIRQYGKAEDTVFEIIEKEPSFVQEGLLFYERLQKKSDDDLREGNLSRNEIAEGMIELRGKK
jgi:Family of unknown function (DUF6483)